MVAFSMDRFKNADPFAVATGCIAVVDAIQNMPKDVQLAALTATFALVCERFDVDRREALVVAERMMHDAVGRRAEFRAAALYVQKELV